MTKTTASAWVGDVCVAHSDDVVTVEGTAYFPLSAVREDILSPSSTKSVCFWKGIASYYTVNADGLQLKNAAFEYRRPSPLARRIKGRVAFWNGVDIRRK